MSHWFERLLRLLRSHLALQSPAPSTYPGSWKARYARDGEDYRRRADGDPFESWEKIKSPIRLVGGELRSALDVAFGEGDPSVYRRYLDRAVMKAERIKRDGLPGVENYHLHQFELGSAQCDEVYARLLRDGFWDRALYNLGVDNMTAWCFDKHLNPRWDDFTKGKALDAARRAVIASNHALSAKLLKRLSKMTPIEDLTLWLAVSEVTKAQRGVALVQQFLAECTKGYDNTPQGVPTYQFELAIMVWVLLGNPLSAISIGDVIQIVYGHVPVSASDVQRTIQADVPVR